jgi:hypothetical protein
MGRPALLLLGQLEAPVLDVTQSIKKVLRNRRT